MLMNDTNFDNAFNKVISSEGSYTNDPKDRGNWTTGIVGKGECKGTKYGISAMSYPNLDIKNLSLNQAKEIYYKDFWLKNGLDKFDPELSYQLFDAIVQHGKSTAIKLLQKILNLTADGILGVTTTKTVLSLNQKILALKYIKQRISYYTSLSTFNIYGKGWVNRMANNLDSAIKNL